MGFVYKITNTVNGKAYIGISVNDPMQGNGRIKEHLVGRGNRIIANAVKKYGKDAFVCEVLEANVFDGLLPRLEVEYIAKFNTVAPHGYNLTTGGEKTTTYSVASRRKMSESRKGKLLSDDTRRKMSESRKGKLLSDDTRRKISESRKGKLPSDDTRRKISKTLKGRKPSVASRRKMSESRKGKKHSAETRRKISEAHMHPSHNAARNFFFSLSSDMPLHEKRQRVRTEFPNVPDSTFRRWVSRWLS